MFEAAELLASSNPHYRNRGNWGRHQYLPEAASFTENRRALKLGGEDKYQSTVFPFCQYHLAILILDFPRLAI
jgi:hypothetical protein